jgi:hypothetical protein
MGSSRGVGGQQLGHGQPPGKRIRRERIISREAAKNAKKEKFFHTKTQRYKVMFASAQSAS